MPGCAMSISRGFPSGAGVAVCEAKVVVILLAIHIGHHSESMSTRYTMDLMHPSFSRVVLVLTTAALLFSADTKRTVTDAEVQRVHRAAILIDTHNDVTSATVDGLDIGK